MGFFDKLKAGLQKTHGKLVHEIKRIVTRSPRMTGESLEELEAALIGADLGMAVTTQIVQAVRKAYETQGGAGHDVFAIAAREVEKNLSAQNHALKKTNRIAAFIDWVREVDPSFAAPRLAKVLAPT